MNESFKSKKKIDLRRKGQREVLRQPLLGFAE